MTMLRRIALVAALLVAALPQIGCRESIAATYSAVRPYTRCPVGGQLVIQPIGDSITAGAVPAGGWRSLVLSYLATARGGSVGPGGVVDSWGDLNNALYSYNASTGSQHSGHPGSSAQQWVDNGWMSTFNPVPSGVADVHFGLLMLGANDAGDTTSSGNAVLTLADQFLVLHPQAVLFVSTRTPRNGSTSTTHNATVTAGVATRRAQGKNVVLVDAYAAVTTGDLYDGLHPSDDGNRKIASAWIGAMAPYVRP